MPCGLEARPASPPHCFGHQARHLKHPCCCRLRPPPARQRSRPSCEESPRRHHGEPVHWVERVLAATSPSLDSKLLNGGSLSLYMTPEGRGTRHDWLCPLLSKGLVEAWNNWHARGWIGCHPPPFDLPQQAGTGSNDPCGRSRKRHNTHRRSRGACGSPHVACAVGSSK